MYIYVYNVCIYVLMYRRIGIVYIYIYILHYVHYDIL